MKYQITTPEQVRFHFEIAGLMSRSMAWVIDQLLLRAAQLGIFIGLASSGFEISIALALLGLFILDFGYYVFFELYWAGQSPGKRYYKIRVVSSRGGRLKFPDVMLRNLLRPLDTLPIAMGIGGLTAFLDKYGRRIGDMAAETLVVRDSCMTLPESLSNQKNRINTFESDVSIKNRILARATRDERDLILDLVLRRDELEPGTREDMFRQAAEYFRKRYALPENVEFLSDEQTVVNIALVILGATFTG